MWQAQTCRRGHTLHLTPHAPQNRPPTLTASAQTPALNPPPGPPHTPQNRRPRHTASAPPPPSGRAGAVCSSWVAMRKAPLPHTPPTSTLPAPTPPAARQGSRSYSRSPATARTVATQARLLTPLRHTPMHRRSVRRGPWMVSRPMRRLSWQVGGGGKVLAGRLGFRALRGGDGGGGPG